MNKNYYVYIITNKSNTTVYTGITNNLAGRGWQRKQKLVDGFTKKYNLTKLVYYELFFNPRDDIQREKQIKGGSRQKKISLINDFNPNWEDLYSKII